MLQAHDEGPHFLKHKSAEKNINVWSYNITIRVEQIGECGPPDTTHTSPKLLILSEGPIWFRIKLTMDFYIGVKSSYNSSHGKLEDPPLLRIAHYFHYT